MTTSIYHYVYRITNILENKHYYGTRTSKNILPIEDIGKKYKSSSTDKVFMREQREHPENFKYKIIREFKDRRTAIKFEILLHNKFNVGVNEKFYNRCKQTSTGWDNTGIKASEETRKKMSTSHSTNGFKHSIEYVEKLRIRGLTNNPMKGKKHTQETIDKMRIAATGVVPSMETRHKISEFHKGKPKSEEHKRKISEVKMGVPTGRSGNQSPQFIGYYIFMCEKFDSSKNLSIYLGTSETTILTACKNSNNKIISRSSYLRSKFLQSLNIEEEIVGKTFKDIGFSFESSKSHISQML